MQNDIIIHFSASQKLDEPIRHQMTFPSALNYPEERESLSAERFGSATDPGGPTGHTRPHDHNGFKNPWHLAHGRVPGPGDPAGRRYPDDRIGGRGSTGLHSAQRPGCDHLGGTPLGEHILRYPHLLANVPRPEPGIPEKSRLCSTQPQKKPLSGPQTALSAAQPGASLNQARFPRHCPQPPPL